MGIKFQFQPRRCAQAINQLFVLALYCSLPAVTVATAAAPKGELFVARELYKKGEYFKAARFAFAATGGDRRTRARAYSWVTLGLIKSGLHHSASYFLTFHPGYSLQDSLYRANRSTQARSSFISGVRHMESDAIHRQPVRLPP